MRGGIYTGVHFGLTSGVITTLGLIVGLHSGTHSELAVIGGILTIAIADAMSDALGIHISKEAENILSKNQLWLATLTTFLTKFTMAGTFIIPILLFSLTTAIIVSVAWGLFVLTFLSLLLARSQRVSPIPVIAEHVGIALAVVIITHFVGDWIGRIFS